MRPRVRLPRRAIETARERVREDVVPGAHERRQRGGGRERDEVEVFNERDGGGDEGTALSAYVQ